MNKDWLDITVLEDYLDGKLDAKTMNKVEREALEDPFLAEALAGLSESPKRTLQSLSLLQKRLHERIAEHQVSKKARIITWQRLSIAATAAVLFISVGIIFWMKQVNYEKMVADKPKKIEVNIAPKVVVKDSIVEPADAVARVKAGDRNRASAAIDSVLQSAKTNDYAANAKPKVKAVVTVRSAPVVTLRENAALSNSLSDIDTNVNLNEVSIARSYQSSPAVKSGSAIVSGKEIKDVPVANVEQLLQGGAPGLRGTINIRRLDSIKENNEDSMASRFTINSRGLLDVQAARVNLLFKEKVQGVRSQATHPAEGWTKFIEYFIKNNRYAQDATAGQSAEFRFEVKALRPVNVSVVKGFSDRFNMEAVRLILNGTDWEVQDPESPIVFITVEY